MGRPTDEQIRAWALFASSRADGSCDDASTRLFGRTWHPYDNPSFKERIAVYIKQEGHARNHWALSATWTGEGETIIDSTIGQFDQHERIFVGTRTEWLAALRAVLPGVSIEIDAGARTYRKALLCEFNPDAANYDEEVTLNFLPKRSGSTAPSTKEDHMFEAMSASSNELRRSGSGFSGGKPSKSGGSRRCTLF